MTDHPIDPSDVLISLAAAALTAAEADAAAPDSELIFRPEWRPTPRTRSSTSQPQGTPEANRSSSWASVVRNQGPRAGLQQDQPLLSPGPRAKRTPPSAYEPPPTSTSVPPPKSQFQEDAVAELLKRNKDVFDGVILHPFPRAFGKGTASLDGFRNYMIQDMLYLQTCTSLKMIAHGATFDFEAAKTFESRHTKSLGYVTESEKICITMLGIPESTVKSTKPSVELEETNDFYKKSLRIEDALLGYYVVLLPCVLTYWRIADRLMKDPLTAKNVVYHTAWTVVNHDDSSAVKYTKFINENIAANGGIDRWNDIFGRACQLEAQLFNTGLQVSPPFQIIPEGKYFIPISSAKSVVLAIQNVKGFLRPPVDKLLAGYFPSNGGLSVVGTKKTGGDNERWHAVPTKAGYTFKNLGTGLYLGISTEPNRKGSRILQAASEPYYWWINPVSSQPAQGSTVYQIYDSANLRYTLHADIEVLNKIGSTDFCYTPIIAHEDSKLGCQMWTFHDKFEQLENLGVKAAKGRLPGAQRGQKADPANPLNIIIGIMGPTGTGKSSFIERLTGDKSIHIGHGVESASSEIGRYNYFCEDGRCVTFVDFPGFDDSRRGVTDTDILRKIAAFLELEFNQDRELSGIIYFHRITDDRMGGISARNLRMFRKLCGDNALKSVVIVTTRWDDVQEKDRGAMDKREKELMETPGKLFEPVVAAGGQFLRHDNTTGSARRVMEAVLQKEPIVLQIQLEMHDGKTLEETAVGSELAAEMEKLMDGHSSEMKNLKAGMAKAIATKDEASKKELEAERTKMQQQMAKWEKQKKALADGLAAERAGVIKRQQEADRKLREQAAEFDRRVKETEARAKEDQRKLQTTLNDISRERAAAAKKLDDLENSKAKSGRTRRERIQPHIDQVRKEKEAADMKYRALLRSMRAQICHWEPFSGTFHSASFNPAPIESGVRDGLSAFVIRAKTDHAGNGSLIYNVPEGTSFSTYNSKTGTRFWDFQVLVGDQARLRWVPGPRQGRFEAKSIGYNPVPAWDQEVGKVSNTQFIARFSVLGNSYSSCLHEGGVGVSCYVDGHLITAPEYEVLCYKDL